MAGCEDCYFGKGLKVGTRGPADSPFVIVGESPGAVELYKGVPFVGPSGTVVIDTLAKIGEAGTDYPEPYWNNAIQCLPRQKDPEKMSAACFACRGRLLEELKAHPRKVIVALGAAALWTLTGDFGLKITKERGKLFRSPLAEVGIVASFHPAFLLRGGGNYTQFHNDLKYAVSLVTEGESARKLPNGTRWRLIETDEEAETFYNELKNLPEGEPVAYDIETTGFNYQTDRILVIGVQHTDGLVTVVPEEFVSLKLFPENVRQIWHNGKFDCRFLRHRLKPNSPESGPRVDEDTMLMSYALNERRGIHDLDQVSSDWIGSTNHKYMVKEYYQGTVIDAETGKKRRRNLSDAPKDLLYSYVGLDLSDTYQLYFKMREEVRADKNLEKFYTQHLIPASAYLIKVEMNGMLVDDTWVMRNHYRLSEEKEGHIAVWNEVSNEVLGYDTNPGSWQQVKSVLYDGGLELAPSSWGTDEDTIDTLLEKFPQHKALTALKGSRKTSKLHGTYVKPLMHDRELINSKKPCVVYPDGRVHTTFLIHGTATSRLASREPNVQNVPRDPLLRGQYRARDGYGILEVDYSQAELRSLACLSRCPDLCEIFNTGKDLHVELSIFLFGEDFTREDKMKAKTVNFGIVYGRTAPSIAEAFGVSIDEAQSWIDGWFTRFPGAAKFIEQCRNAPILNQTITTVFGNKKRPGVVSREKLRDLQNESANFPHQSIASNLTIRAGIELFDVLRDDYDTHIINTVHDCIVTEVPLNVETIKAASKLMMSTMEAIPLRYKGLDIVPFKAEPEFGLRWGNLLKFKEIEALGWDLSKVPDYVAAH